MYRSSNSIGRSGREIKLQDVFLNYCRRERITVEIQTLDNSIQKGTIIGFDNHAIILEENNRQHLVYKSAAVAVNPLSAVNHIFNEHGSRSPFINERTDDDCLDRYAEYSADFS